MKNSLKFGFFAVLAVSAGFALAGALAQFFLRRR